MHLQLGGNLFLVTLTFDLDIQTRPSEGPNTKHVFLVNLTDANPFSGSRDISYTNKKVVDSAKNRIALRPVSS